MENNMFNESLLNKNYEKILDIIGEPFKSKKHIIKNRSKVLSLLQETIPSISIEQLESCFNLAYKDVLDIKNDTIINLNHNIFLYSKFICEISKEYNDFGYSMLIFGYFWLISNYLGKGGV